MHAFRLSAAAKGPRNRLERHTRETGKAGARLPRARGKWQRPARVVRVARCGVPKMTKTSKLRGISRGWFPVVQLGRRMTDK